MTAPKNFPAVSESAQIQLRVLDQHAKRMQAERDAALVKVGKLALEVDRLRAINEELREAL